MKFEIVKVPRYYLPSGPIVLDGDIYHFFCFKSVRQFRKKLKGLEDKKTDQGIFRLNTFDKYFIKTQNKYVPHLNTSAEAFAFTQDLFLQMFPEFKVEDSVANRRIDKRLSLSKLAASF